MSIMFQRAISISKLPPQVEAFYQEFIDATTVVINPECVTRGERPEKYRQFGPDAEAVGISLVHGGFYPNRKQTTFILDDFNAATKRAGHGSFALDCLTDLADKYRIRLELRAQPTIGKFVMNGAFIPDIPEEKLWNFYGNHSFFLPPNDNHCAPIMIRPPQRS